MPMNWTGACQLHIPFKDWASDPQEKQNYETIEQWSYRLPGCWSEHAGTATPHRVTYQTSYFWSPSASASTTVLYGNNSNCIADWTHAAGSDLLNESVFVPDSTTVPSVPQLKITASGLLSWAGHLYYNPSSSSAAGGAYYSLWDYTGLDMGQVNATGNDIVAGARELAIGGGAYVEAGTSLYLTMRQNTGIDGTGYAAVTWTLMEF